VNPLRTWRSNWAKRRANWVENRAWLRRVADELGCEWEAMSYEDLRDKGPEELSFSRVVDGRRVHCSGESTDALKNGDLEIWVDLDCEDLATGWLSLPSYHFYKRPDGSVYY
jgi:hypothetical protein